MPPDPQILRLKDWFSRYDFCVKHIKGKNNLIPDFLYRPTHKTVKVITSTHSFPLIFMAKPLSETAKTVKMFPPGLVTHTPAQILEYAKSHYFHFLHETMRFKHTPAQIFNPEIPFVRICQHVVCHQRFYGDGNWILHCVTPDGPNGWFTQIPPNITEQFKYTSKGYFRVKYLCWGMLESHGFM